jgi:hypothetical protein
MHGINRCLQESPAALQLGDLLPGWLTPAAAVGVTAALLAAAPAFADTPMQIAQAVSSGPFVPGALLRFINGAPRAL